MSSASPLIFWLVLALATGALFVGFDMQTQTDTHQSFRLAFPSDLATDQVLTWLTALSGTLRGGPGRLLGASVPSMVFEVHADEREISHRLTVPAAHVGYVVPQLRSLVPGITVTPDDQEAAGDDWTRAVELKQTNPARSLHIPDSEALSTSVLTTMQGLKQREALMLQWVVAPAVQERLPRQAGEVKSSDFSITRALLGNTRADRDEITERRAKLSHPNFLGVLRVAAKAGNPDQADRLIGRVRTSLASVRTPSNRFTKRLVSSARVIERVKHASGVAVFPIQLAAPELAALLAWPLGEPHVAGLPQQRTRHLPATGAIPRSGRVVMRSNFPGGERPLALTPLESAQHLQVVGPTGSGKTALLANLITQDMHAGRPVVLIESKGDLFTAALERVPKKRINDVVLLDVTDTDNPVGFNILQGNPYAVAADIQRLFDHLYPQDARGVRVRQGFYHLILTLMMSTGADGPMTFADIGALSTPRADQTEFADNLIRGVSHIEELASWWQEISNLPRAQRDLYFKPLTDRTWQLTSRRSIRNIIGQAESTIDLVQVIKQNKILLVNLGRATEGTDTAGLLGSLLLNSLWSAVQAGAADPTNPTMLYLDEFQDFLNLPIAPADMFAQARSRGLAMTVAHQFIGQLSRELQDATANNARSTVVFQTGADEARHFARQFGRSVTEDDFIHLRRFEVIARFATDDGVSAPVTGVTLPPADPSGHAGQARQQSRSTYARPVAQVEQDITRRRGAGAPIRSTTTKRRFGGKGWND